jgi:hypothetical protein
LFLFVYTPTLEEPSCAIACATAAFTHAMLAAGCQVDKEREKNRTKKTRFHQSKRLSHLSHAGLASTLPP